MQRPLASSTASSAGPPSAADSSAAWDDLAEVLDRLALLAIQPSEEDRFHSELLRLCTTALAADGGAVWRADASGRLRRIAVIGTERPLDERHRRAHEAHLAGVVSTRQPMTSVAAGGDDNKPIPQDVRIVAPIVADSSAPILCLVEITLRAGSRPSTYDAATQFLEAACQLAGQRQLRTELQQLRTEQDEHFRFVELSRRVHGDLDLTRTCHRIANETREAIRCDRVSVLSGRNKPMQLVAVSGADHIDRRSRLSQSLEKLAQCVARLGEPLYLAEGELPDADEPVAQLLQQYADSSHARQLIAYPLHSPTDHQDEAVIEQRSVVGVMVVEHFDATKLLVKDAVVTAAELCAPALNNATEVGELPLLGLSRALGSMAAPSTQRRLLGGAFLAVATIACLMLVPATLYVESVGELQPVVKKQIFAPRDSLVAAVYASHGQRVSQGDTLLELRDPELELALEQLQGELATARRQLETALATRTGRDARDTSPADAYRLSAEQQLIEQRIASLQSRRKLLMEQKQELVVNSPATGSIISWQVEETLAGRPVERGQMLLTVADTSEDWRLELQTPDDRIGHLLDAARSSQAPLRVEYRLASEEEGFATGTVTKVAQRAETSREEEGSTSVFVMVTPDNPRQPAKDAKALRPGLSVRARIDCGRRSLGYVWFHDLLHTVNTWWEF